MLAEAGALGGTVSVWRVGIGVDGVVMVVWCRRRGEGKVRYNSDDSDGQVYTHHRH